MSEFENVVPYTQAELDQQEIWAKEFDQWWGSEGQYHRAGGNDYCRTFAWFAWLSREQSKQSEIDQLKAKNTALVHALVNTNAEKTKWAHSYWAQVERTAEYGAMLISNPDSLEFSCFKKEKEIEKLKAEKAGFKNLVKSLRSEFDLNSDCPQVDRQIELLEEALRGEHE
ncbi:MAG: hypothetical protein ACN6OV_05905 [Acinetobacter sp.]|uniref:hypothetical protein n=1 Tax=Acinetobacter sp. TaxID=472 RepID=UPI003D0198B1